MNVYWFQDSKTGHLKQVQALLDQLKKETELSLTTIKHSDQESFSEMFSRRDQFSGQTILIGAGHDVYSTILQAKKYLQKFDLISNEQFSFSYLMINEFHYGKRYLFNFC